MELPLGSFEGIKQIPGRLRNGREEPLNGNGHAQEQTGWTRVEDGNEDNAGTIRWKDMDKGGGW